MYYYIYFKKMNLLTKSRKILYNYNMKFKVEKIPEAEKEYLELTDTQRKILDRDFEIIETIGIEFVKRRFLQKGIFEIKSNDIRALFKYKENAIILIGLIYVKKSRKAPDDLIKLAKTRLKGE